MRPDWAVCEEPGCFGARADRERCIVHAVEPSALAQRLRDGESLDARGVRLDQELLLPWLRDLGGGDVLFDGATFERDVVLRGMAFRGDVSFREATFAGDFDADEARFESDVTFYRARFAGSASFHGATFDGDFDFEGASVAGDATFSAARFASETGFVDCRFDDEALFHGTQFVYAVEFERTVFGGDASFHAAQFEDRVDFGRAVFAADAWFDRTVFTERTDYSDATFEADAWFYGTRFAGRARFDRVTFSGAAGFVDGTFGEGVSFDGASFQQVDLILDAPAYVSLERTRFAVPTALDLMAPRITCRGARFAEGGEVRLRGGDIALDGAHFGRPLVVAGTASPAPRVVSLRQADAGSLLLADVDLRACRFVGAHGLDRLRLEGTVRFAAPPQAWHGPRRWTRRWTLAEEQEWRASRGHDPGWYAPECRPPAWLEDLGLPLDPSRIALLYRALRKGREDGKDEPGAADFYYGEMEMRRHAERTRVERAVLWTYWLVSGYGLRAARALGALTLTVVAFGLALWGFGFEPDQSLARALVFSAESTSSLFRAPELPDASLTYAGEVLQMALRLLGPLFLGLALLALRARVKR